MALISMAVFDTEENNRTNYTKKTLYSLHQTVDFTKHRLIIVDNGSCQKTKDEYHYYAYLYPEDNVKFIFLDKNIGTAEAINQAWKLRNPGEHCIKIDNDVVIQQYGWADELEEAANREPKIGQVALKRKDLGESPNAENPYLASKLLMLQHKNGERWIVFEKCNHVMGTCVLHSSALLDAIGYLYQVGLYGFDDSFMSLRSQIAGFINGFLPHIDIEHIDDGKNSYTQEKVALADKAWAEVQEIMREYKSGKRDVYYNPFG